MAQLFIFLVIIIGLFIWMTSETGQALIIILVFLSFCIVGMYKWLGISGVWIIAGTMSAIFIVIMIVKNLWRFERHKKKEIWEFKYPENAMAAMMLTSDRDVLAEVIKKSKHLEVVEEACIRLGGHDWDGCVCKRCGKTDKGKPDEAHDWDGCKCKRCGRSGNHDWGDGCVCKRCRKKAEWDEEHLWEYIETKTETVRNHAWEQDYEWTYDVYRCSRCGETKREEKKFY